MELSLIHETKKIIDESFEKYYEINNNYYKHVLDFLNSLFNDDSKSILKIKFKKITLSEDIFTNYNEIIQNFKLNKDFFDTKNFNINDIYDFSDIINIAITMANNLLFKLHYKISIFYINNKKKLKIKSI